MCVPKQSLGTRGYGEDTDSPKTFREWGGALGLRVTEGPAYNGRQYVLPATAI
jgi:hypothetical protein